MRTAEIDRWLGGLTRHPITKSNIRKIFITFGNWAKANRYLIPLPNPSHLNIQFPINNHKGFTLWMTGDGVKGGFSHGETDDHGYAAITGKVYIHD